MSTAQLNSLREQLNAMERIRLDQMRLLEERAETIRLLVEDRDQLLKAAKALVEDCEYVDYNEGGPEKELVDALREAVGLPR